MFKITAIPALRDNYIWGLELGGRGRRDRRAALVDPGEDTPALAWLERRKLRLEAILITHHHYDHQGGVAGLLERFPDVSVFGPRTESITGLTHPLSGGERIFILDTEVEVLPVAGHTRGHVAYLAEDALFCGDTLFGAGCGRIFEGTPAQMFAALQRIASLPDTTRIFCAHEYTLENLCFATLLEPDNPAVKTRVMETLHLLRAGKPTVPSSLGAEKASNPFLRYAEPVLQEMVRKKNPDALTDELVFTELRAVRDMF
jgi:hydroxyacylglutathione hydrolase